MITRTNYTTLRDEIATRLAAHLGHVAPSIFAPPAPEPTDAECRELIDQYRVELAWQISARLEAEAVYAGTHRLWRETATQRDDLRETVSNQRESIISLRRQLTEAVDVADAANRDAAAATKAMEVAGVLSGRLRGLLLRVAASEDVVMPSDLYYKLQALAVELANDGGRVAKDCNDKESR